MALELACEHLLSLQDRAGWWQGELQTNVTMDAEDMLLREFLGVRRADETERSAAWIRSQQRADGTWTNFYGGPGDLSTTIEAYWALRLAGDPADAEHMRIAAEFVREQGGLANARVFTHLWLALFGLWSWEDVPALPPEIVLLPSWFPLNIYDFACWARQTIVALSLVKTHRPARELPFALDELHVARPQAAPEPQAAPRARWLARADRLLRAYERRPLRPLRRIALARAERWIVRRQEADGSWGGIQPPWVYSLIALHLSGYAIDHPVMRRGLEGLDSFMVEDRDDSRSVGAPAGPSRRLEACQSPVWDTALVADRAQRRRAARRPPGAHARRRLAARRGGRRSRRLVGRAPAARARRLGVRVRQRQLPRRRRHRRGRARAAPRQGRARGCDGAVERAARWVEGMQSSGGGWGAFDAENTRTMVRELPFLDFGEVIDEPSADVSAHALEMLAELGLADTLGRPARHALAGRAAGGRRLVVRALGRQPRLRHRRRRARADRRRHGPLPTSASSAPCAGCSTTRTKTAAGARIRAPTTRPSGSGAARAPPRRPPGRCSRCTPPKASPEAIERGVGWLVATQRADGGWDEPQYTGTGFPSDYYINYHLYRLAFPIMALGRCRR